MWALLLLRAHPKPQHRQRVEFPLPSEGTSAEDSCSSLLTHPARPIDGMLRCHVCPQIATARHGPGRMGQCWVGSAGSRLEVSLGRRRAWDRVASAEQTWPQQLEVGRGSAAEPCVWRPGRTFASCVPDQAASQLACGLASGEAGAPPWHHCPPSIDVFEERLLERA